jgi:hypothetical protein
VNGIEQRLSEALEERAQAVRPGPQAWVENQRRLAGDRRRRRVGACVAAAAALVVTVGTVQLIPLVRRAEPVQPATAVLYGLSGAEAQRLLEGCARDAYRGGPTHEKPPRPISAYRPVFGVRDLYKDQTGKKITVVMARAEGSAAISCFGQLGGTGRLHVHRYGEGDSAPDRSVRDPLTVFLTDRFQDWRGTFGFYTAPTTRVTVQYLGGREQDARMGNGAWAYGGNGYDQPPENPKPPASIAFGSPEHTKWVGEHRALQEPIIRAYDAHGRLVEKRGEFYVTLTCRGTTDGGTSCYQQARTPTPGRNRRRGDGPGR